MYLAEVFDPYFDTQLNTDFALLHKIAVFIIYS